MKNSVFIATSSDGFIATLEGDIDWLTQYPNPENNDFGYHEFMNSIDAIIMGRKTYEKVLSFDCDWPYSKMVFVLSSTLKSIDSSLQNKAKLINGTPLEVVQKINASGFHNVYVDGAQTIQSFLNENLIDQMIITTVPINLGSGISLFKDNLHEDKFKLISKKNFYNGMTQSTYERKEF